MFNVAIVHVCADTDDFLDVYIDSVICFVLIYHRS